VKFSSPSNLTVHFSSLVPQIWVLSFAGLKVARITLKSLPEPIFHTFFWTVNCFLYDLVYLVSFLLFPSEAIIFRLPPPPSFIPFFSCLLPGGLSHVYTLKVPLNQIFFFFQKSYCVEATSTYLGPCHCQWIFGCVCGVSFGGGFCALQNSGRGFLSPNPTAPPVPLLPGGLGGYFWFYPHVVFFFFCGHSRSARRVCSKPPFLATFVMPWGLLSR